MQWGNAGSLQRFTAGYPRQFVKCFALADQHERQVRHRGQIAAGADTATTRNPGIDRAIEEIAQALGDHRPCAGESFG